MIQTLQSDQPASPLANGMVIQCKGWIKGSKARMDMTLPSLGMQMTNLVMDGWVYTVMGPNMGFKIKLPDQVVQQAEALPSLADPDRREKALAAMKAQKVGTETVQVGTDPVREVVCDAYDFTGTLQGLNLNLGNLGLNMPGGTGGDPFKDAHGKMWLDRETGLPVKLVTQMPAMQMSVTVEYRTFKVGVEVPDDQFVLPEGVQWQDLTALFQGLFQGPTPAPPPAPQP
jgi:outer membrane lipoprotein-sorting protein